MDIIRDYGREFKQDRQKEADIFLGAFLLGAAILGPSTAKFLFKHAPNILNTVKDHGRKYVDAYLASKGGLPPGAVEALRQEEEKNQPVVDDQALKAVQKLYTLDGQHAVKSMRSVSNIQGPEGLQRIFDAIDVYEGAPSKKTRRTPIKTKPVARALKKMVTPPSSSETPEAGAVPPESTSIPVAPPSESGTESVPGEYLG